MSTHHEHDEISRRLDPAVWRMLGPFLRPYRRRLVAIGVAMSLGAAVSVSLPLFQRYAVDRFVVPQTSDGLLVFVLLYLGALLLQAGLTLFFSRLCMQIEMGLGCALKRACFVRLQYLSLPYYNQTPVGYILARVMSDTNRIATMVAWSFLDLFFSLLYVIFAFVAMFMLNTRLALLVLIVVPAVALIALLFQGKILRVNRDMRAINSRITGAYNEGITGAKTSKTLVIEERNCAEFSDISAQMYRKSLHGTRLSATFIPLVLFCGSLATAFVLAQGGLLVQEQLIAFGMLSAFVSYAVSILEPVQQIAVIFSEFVATQVNLQRVGNLLKEEELVRDSDAVTEAFGDVLEPKQDAWPPLRGDITFEHVTFRYPDGDTDVLQDFCLHIPAGLNVAIVGETGAGKSTLVNLACRFFEPTAGRILVDGVDYRERSQLWLQSHLGYVLQNPHLFSGTVRDNIRYGRLDATDEEVQRAAELVSADLVVAKLPHGYDTDVGEGGDRLSTGEKQLISFARAVLCDPPIFVLDEATASIDTETEQLIQQAISHILRGRTSFVIAHRLSTIRQADLILVVDNGTIVEQGTHAELIAHGGHYRDLYTAMQIDEVLN